MATAGARAHNMGNTAAASQPKPASRQTDEEGLVSPKDIPIGAAPRHIKSFHTRAAMPWLALHMRSVILTTYRVGSKATRAVHTDRMSEQTRALY